MGSTDPAKYRTGTLKYDELPEEIRICLQPALDGSAGAATFDDPDEAAAMLPWFVDMMTAELQVLKDSYNSGDVMSLASVVATFHQQSTELATLVADLLSSYFLACAIEPEQIKTWVSDEWHNEVVFPQVQEILRAYGWAEEYVEVKTYESE